MDLLPPLVDLGLLAAAVVLHEVGHGVVAYGCGDKTAAESGRLTLNPLRHIDPFGTVVLPLMLAASAWMAGAQPFLFGYAKPVPVDPRRMRHPRRDMALVAMAGPLVNLGLALLAALVLGWTFTHVEGEAVRPLRYAALTAVSLNCVLATLNLMPIPPLDGGRVLASLMPRALVPLYGRLERYGMLLVMLLLLGTPALPLLVGPVFRLVLRLTLPSSVSIG